MLIILTQAGRKEYIQSMVTAPKVYLLTDQCQCSAASCLVRPDLSHEATWNLSCRVTVPRWR